MPVTPEGFWIPPMSPKQALIYNCYKRVLLVSGPKSSGKTIGVADKAVRHAFDTDGARVGIFTKTTKVAKDGGCWTDLMDTIEKNWIPAGLGLSIVTGPKQDSTTRQLFVDISNRHGTTSRFVLNSLDYDDDIDSKVKGKRFSMIWFNELSNFKKRKVIQVAIDQLKIKGLPYGAHQFIADTNPADDGEQSWIYKMWYVERLLEEPPEYCENEEGRAAFRQFQEELGLIEIMIEDNPFLEPEQRSAIYGRFQQDQDLFNRYCLGKWTSSTVDSVFSDQFKPGVHIIGNTDSINPDQWEMLLPEENCSALLTGWDVGAHKNHCIHIIEPAVINDRKVYKVLDEIALIGERIALEEIVEIVMERMDFWEKQIGKPIEWRHWSDRSAFDSWNMIAQSFQHTFIYNVSAGRIELRAAPKYPTSLRDRVDMTRRLLFQDRLLISATCPVTIKMFRALKRARANSDTIERATIHKHPFDSLTYPLHAEEPINLVNSIFAKEGKAKPASRMVLMGV